MVFYKRSFEPAYALNDSFIRQYPVLYNDSELLIIASGACNEQRPYTKSFLADAQERFVYSLNVTINTDSCFVMFKDYPLAERTCNFINGRGFSLDEDRTWI